MLIVCPSGLSLTVRGMRGKEIKLLTGKEAKNGQFLDRLFDSCVEKVTDPGPYKLNENSALIWDDVLIGDRMFVMLQIRVATFGAQYGFGVKCGACEKKMDYDVDLTTLEVQPLSDADRAAVRDGNTMTAIVAGKRVTFRLATGKDERRAAQAKKQDDAILSIISNRVTAIEGVENVKAHLQETGLEEIMDLMHEVNKHDCGVDTKVEFECPECFAKSEVELPLGPSFWIGKIPIK